MDVRNSELNYQQMLDRETVPVPEALRTQCEPLDDMGTIPVARYLDRAFHDLEKEKLWPRVWQVVCRESEVAQPGDFFVHEIAGYSVFLQRDSEGTLRAFRNACLHRGRQLKSETGAGRGNSREIRCPFHGFRWHLDGAFNEAPCQDEFPQIVPENFSLPQASLETWGGWVFVNLDRQAGPLREQLGVIAEHFERWDTSDCYKAVHIRKVVNCNWKLAHEAFIESFHTITTHPQLLAYTGDVNSQYDCFSDHVSRTITPMGVASPHLGDPGEAFTTEGYIAEHDLPDAGEFPDGMAAREWLGELNRQRFEQLYGRSMQEVTHAEVLDAILYSLFPNFAPWGGFRPNLNYRFLPYRDRHEQCTMEIMVLMRYPAGQERPKDATPIFVDEHQRLADVEGVSAGLAKVFDQDFSNLPLVQRGLPSLESGQIQLARYQEQRIWHFHRTLEKYLYNETEPDLT